MACSLPACCIKWELYKQYLGDCGTQKNEITAETTRSSRLSSSMYNPDVSFQVHIEHGIYLCSDYFRGISKSVVLREITLSNLITKIRIKKDFCVSLEYESGKPIHTLRQWRSVERTSMTLETISLNSYNQKLNIKTYTR